MLSLPNYSIFWDVRLTAGNIGVTFLNMRSRLLFRMKMVNSFECSMTKTFNSKCIKGTCDLRCRPISVFRSLEISDLCLTLFAAREGGSKYRVIFSLTSQLPWNQEANLLTLNILRARLSLLENPLETF